MRKTSTSPEPSPLEAPMYVGPCVVVAISAINPTAGAISGVLALAWIATIVLSRKR